MPNHFHGILMIVDGAGAGAGEDAGSEDVNVGATRRVARTGTGTLQSGSLGAIIGQFKAAVTRRINIYRVAHSLPPAEVWHRNYFERVVRNEKELDDTGHYIKQNSLNWDNDEHHPDAVS